MNYKKLISFALLFLFNFNIIRQPYIFALRPPNGVKKNTWFEIRQERINKIEPFRNIDGTNFLFIFVIDKLVYGEHLFDAPLTAVDYLRAIGTNSRSDEDKNRALDELWSMFNSKRFFMPINLVSKIVIKMDLNKYLDYEHLIFKETGSDISYQDLLFLVGSLGMVLSFDKRNIASEKEAVEIVIKERYPLFKKVKEKFADKRNWQDYTHTICILLNMCPNLDIEEINPQMKFNFEKDMLLNMGYLEEFNGIMSRIPRDKIAFSKIIDVLNLMNLCKELSKFKLLKNVFSDVSFDRLEKISDYLHNEIFGNMEIRNKEIYGYTDFVLKFYENEKLENFRLAVKYLDNFIVEFKKEGIETVNIVESVVPAMVKVSKTTKEFEDGLNCLKNLIIKLNKKNLSTAIDKAIEFDVFNKIAQNSNEFLEFNSNEFLEFKRCISIWDSLLENGIHLEKTYQDDSFWEIIKCPMTVNEVMEHWNDLLNLWRTSGEKAAKLIRSPLVIVVKETQRMDSFIHGLKFLQEYEDHLQRILECNYFSGNIFPTGFTREAIADLSIDIISSEVLSYINVLEDLLALKTIRNMEYEIFRNCVTNCQIDLRIRMKVCEDYIELVTIREMLGDESLKQIIDSINNKIKTMESGSLSKSQMEKCQEAISRELIPVRKLLVKHLLDREISAAQQKLLEDRMISKQILTIAGIVATTKFEEKVTLQNCFKGYLNELFSSFDPNRVDGIEQSKKKAQKWLMGLDNETLKKIESGKGRQFGEKHLCNKGIIGHLQSKGYKKELWTKGIEVKRVLSEGITTGKKREKILSSSYEMVEIAIDEGLKEIEGKILTLDYAENLDNYDKTNEFYKLVKTSGILSVEKDERIKDIVEMVSRIEKLPIEKVLKEEEFKVTIKKDFLSEATAGIGVPGCFHPRGGHREMPVVHASESNSFFIQIFNKAGDQVGNAVVILDDKGVFVYKGYDYSPYDLDILYAEALKELSKYVPKTFMTKISAGFKIMEQYAKKKPKIGLEKPATIFLNQYYDWGVVVNGRLTLTLPNVYVVTKNSIEINGGFKKVREKISFETNLRTDWSRLLISLRQEEFMQYKYLIGELKKKVSTEGKIVLNSDFKEWVGEKIENKNDIEKITEILIKFLQEQRLAKNVKSKKICLQKGLSTTLIVLFASLVINNLSEKFNDKYIIHLTNDKKILSSYNFKTIHFSVFSSL